mmetsp:Transcript_22777/g.52924  ORF Transcript_22777/g.52924 Transcript_22777/m.52924 type:complete len:259 (-) Transcript_22777:137-913(-)
MPPGLRTLRISSSIRGWLSTLQRTSVLTTTSWDDEGISLMLWVICRGVLASSILPIWVSIAGCMKVLGSTAVYSMSRGRKRRFGANPAPRSRTLSFESTTEKRSRLTPSMPASYAAMPSMPEANLSLYHDFALTFLLSARGTMAYVVAKAKMGARPAAIRALRPSPACPFVSSDRIEVACPRPTAALPLVTSHLFPNLIPNPTSGNAWHCRIENAGGVKQQARGSPIATIPNISTPDNRILTKLTRLQHLCNSLVSRR